MSLNYYEPQEDTYMMIDVINGILNKHEISKSLEIGIGNGEISRVLSAKTSKHIGVDINPDAILQTKKICSRGEYFYSDLFENVTGKYDLIVFNPPYLPEVKGEEEDFIKKAIVGGKKGCEVILRFLDELSDFLLDDGICLLLFSNLSKPNIILQKISESLFDYELLLKKSFMMEEIYVYSIFKSEILQKLNKSKYEHIKYFAKGKRGIIYKAKNKELTYAIKIKNKDSFSQNSISNEATNLRFVNSIGIGPKLKEHNLEFNFVSYEFVDGVCWNKYYENADLETIKKIVLNVLPQCNLMDLSGFEKQEMSRPHKNLLIHNECPVLIDFERGLFKKRCSNTTQFLQYLTKSKFSNYLKEKYGVDFKKNIDINLSKRYVSDNKNNFEEVLNAVKSSFED